MYMHKMESKKLWKITDEMARLLYQDNTTKKFRQMFVQTKLKWEIEWGGGALEL